MKTHDKIIALEKFFSNITYKTDTNSRLVCEARSTIRQTLQGKSKSVSTNDILGIGNDNYRKRIEFQFTPEMKWLKI